MRVLYDTVTGRRWQVWVADTRHVPGAPSTHCLLFDSGDTVRRVWQVPDDWSHMAARALLDLAEHTPAPRVAHVRRDEHPPPASAVMRPERGLGLAEHTSRTRPVQV